MAVEAFLADQISWCDIVAGRRASAMDRYVADPLDSLAALYENDAAARRWAHGSLN